MTNPQNNPHDASADTYDRGIVPAETAARKEREEEDFKDKPEKKQSDLETTDGYTTDSEGLTNNYAVEPEMYVEKPGDLREAEEAATADRSEEMREVNQNEEQGKLSSEEDDRGKGVGII